MKKRREEVPTPSGRRRLFPTGGPAGRSPGQGNRSRANTGSGKGGRDRPAQGFARSKYSPANKPPDRLPQIILKPPPKPKS